MRIAALTGCATQARVKMHRLSVESTRIAAVTECATQARVNAPPECRVDADCGADGCVTGSCEDAPPDAGSTRTRRCPSVQRRLM